MLEGSLIYLLIHECNHLNRFLRFMLQPIEDSFSPRDLSFYQINVSNFAQMDNGTIKGEGGRYLCKTLFDDNLIEINLEQSEFLTNVENWQFDINSLTEIDSKIKFKLKNNFNYSGS